MKIPLSWLQEYIDIKLEPKVLADTLTMAGLEVGAVEEFEGDIVLDLEITPNRSDCLSLIGVARELKALFKANLIKPSFKIEKELKEQNFKISILDPDLCFRYAGRIIKSVKVSSSPDWLRSRLEKAGIRSINNVVDITNYVLLEYGHPLHAFDLDLLKGYCIRVGTVKSVKGKESTEIETLDGVLRKVTTQDLLIWDGERPVAVAGVMGGANTEVRESTKNILLESAYFKPESVRKTAKRLGLSTEASYRFERGTDIENLKLSLDRAAYLIQEIAGGDVYEVIDVYPTKIPQREIKFSTEKIRKFIGISLSDEEIIEILSSLEIEVKREGELFIATVPTHRNDLSIEEDIAEEVARIYGYDRVPAELPKTLKPVSENHELAKKRKFLNQLRESLIALGFSEAVNMSFMAPDDLDILEIPKEDRRRNFVSLLNPLRQEESVMRTTLIPGIIRNIEKNTSKGIENIKLFEIGRVFITEENSQLPKEPTHLGLVVKKEEYRSPFGEDPYDFYSLKGVIDGFLRSLKLSNPKYQRSNEPFLHPGKSADIIVDNITIGSIGELSPKVISKYDFKTKPKITIAELNLDTILEIHQRAITSMGFSVYKPLSNYPPIKRDNAFLVDVDLQVEKILDLINQYGSELLEDIYVFDLYTGKGIPEGKKSIALRFTYRASDRTLLSEEIDRIHNELVDKILKFTQAELRA